MRARYIFLFAFSLKVIAHLISLKNGGREDNSSLCQNLSIYQMAFCVIQVPKLVGSFLQLTEPV